MSKTRNAVIANLTYVIGQLEELKSNVNDTMRYIKQNPEEWHTKDEEAALKSEPQKEEEETPQ